MGDTKKDIQLTQLHITVNLDCNRNLTFQLMQWCDITTFADNLNIGFADGLFLTFVVVIL